MIEVNDSGVITKFSGTGEYIGGVISSLIATFANRAAELFKEDGCDEEQVKLIIGEIISTTLLTAVVAVDDEVIRDGMLIGIADALEEDIEDIKKILKSTRGEKVAS